MTESEKPQSNIISLWNSRLEKKKRSAHKRKDYLDSETRIRELEEDMVRAIDMIILLESNLHYQEKMINRILHLLKTSE